MKLGYCSFDVYIQLMSNSLCAGPGLAIRVICAEEAYMCKDFAETSILLKFLMDFSNSVKTVCINKDVLKLDSLI